jgi:hypothetical protein
MLYLFHVGTVYLFAVLGIEPGASHLWAKCSVTDL